MSPRRAQRCGRVATFVSAHRDLVAWQKAYALGLELYEATRAFPQSEAFGLIGQLRRAGVSVSSNIAEGRGRESTRDFIRFLNVASGSLAEIDTQLRFAKDLEYLPPGRAGLLLLHVDECARLISSLRSALRRSLAKSRLDPSRSPRPSTSAQPVEDPHPKPAGPRDLPSPRS